MVTGNEDNCKKCKHDMAYHDEDGCNMAGCRCKKVGDSYDEALAKIRVCDKEYEDNKEK